MANNDWDAEAAADRIRNQPQINRLNLSKKHKPLSPLEIFIPLICLIAAVIGFAIFPPNVETKNKKEFTSPYLKIVDPFEIVVTLKDGKKVRIRAYKYIHTIEELKDE